MQHQFTSTVRLGSLSSSFRIVPGAKTSCIKVLRLEFGDVENSNTISGSDSVEMDSVETGCDKIFLYRTVERKQYNPVD